MRAIHGITRVDPFWQVGDGRTIRFFDLPFLAYLLGSDLEPSEIDSAIASVDGWGR